MGRKIEAVLLLCLTSIQETIE